VACDSSGGEEDPAAPFTVRDSAGVTIAESAEPLWADDEAWSLASEPSLVIGADPADTTQLLHRVYGVERFPGDTIVVGDWGAKEIYAFGPNRTRLWTIRQGEGPGEIQSFFGLHRCGRDRFMVDEASRVSFFDASGQFLRSTPLVDLWQSPADAVGVSSDCASILFEAWSPPPPPRPNAFRMPYALYWATSEGPDTVVRFDGEERLTMLHEGAGAQVSFFKPWGLEPKWTTDGDAVYFGDSGSPEIRRYGREGELELVMRWNLPPRPVTDEDRAIYGRKRREMLDELDGELRQIVRFDVPELDRFPSIGAERPYYLRMLVDDAGRLWVQDYPRSLGGYPRVLPDAGPGDPPVTWWVFDRDGRWLTSIDLPAELTVQSVQDDAVIAVVPDELEIESLAVYPILKPAR